MRLLEGSGSGGGGAHLRRGKEAASLVVAVQRGVLPLATASPVRATQAPSVVYHHEPHLRPLQPHHRHDPPAPCRPEPEPTAVAVSTRPLRCLTMQLWRCMLLVDLIGKVYGI